MKSKVHPTYKTKYRVANWPAYNQALVRCGDVTVWLSSEAITAWTPRWSGSRHGSRLRTRGDDARTGSLGCSKGRCCMKTPARGERTSRDPPQEPHYRDEVEGPSHV